MNRNRRIAIVLSHNTPWHRAVLGGIPLHTPRTSRWDFLLTRPDNLGEEQLRAWGPDGVIGSFSLRRTVRLIRELGAPAVTISENIRGIGLPAVLFDCVKAGRMAADHLSDAGLHHFAYVGWGGHGASPPRFAGFRERLAEVRRRPQFLELRGFGGEQPLNDLIEWLPTLDRPVGVFAFNDITAATVIHAAQAISLRVPDDIAVLGVDNDEAICSFTTPPVSSVEARPLRIGRLAADLLDRLLAGEHPEESRILVPPRGVVERASTDHLAIDDERIARAVRYIRARVGTRINVAEVARATGIGRRVLELGMHRALGHSPLEEIQRARLKIARHLLADTQVHLDEVAGRSGYRDLNHMARTFRDRLGTSPARYRKRHGSARRMSIDP
ncbi:MAG: substrate-binding domain-containing protein [Opitutales bacterium]|nr:substrate-binding domain-containing protein [Opitutales bacterium]